MTGFGFQAIRTLSGALLNKSNFAELKDQMGQFGDRYGTLSGYLTNLGS